jgi:hypothetical protein
MRVSGSASFAKSAQAVAALAAALPSSEASAVAAPTAA